MSRHAKTTRQKHTLPSIPCHAPEIGPWIAALTECRERTGRLVVGAQATELDWAPPGGGNTIGTLLYHIAAIEIDWLYSDILDRGFPDDFREWFPHDVRDPHGNLTLLRGDDIERHQSRLHYVRTQLLDVLRAMSLSDFRRVRHLEAYDVAPEWVIQHLVQHEAQHRGQMAVLRRRFERRNAVPSN